jgi:hypothetical protein
MQQAFKIGSVGCKIAAVGYSGDRTVASFYFERNVNDYNSTESPLWGKARAGIQNRLCRQQRES